MSNGGLVSQIAGGWQVSGIGTYRSGIPIGTIMTSSCLVPNAGGCYASYNPSFSGPARINGGWGSGNLTGSNTATFLDASAFVTPVNYTYGNTPRTGAFGISNPNSYGVDVNLRREFVLRENLKLSLQGDAFNVFNLVTWGAPSTNISSSAFGKITSQANQPRVLQIGARITF